MSENRIQQLLSLQSILRDSIEELAEALRQQVDLLVDIKLFEIEFQDEATTDLTKMEISLFETELLFDELNRIDEWITEINSNIELVTQQLENLWTPKKYKKPDNAAKPF